MKPVKPLLVGLALLLVVSQAHAEYRTVLVQIKQDKDKKASVTIYSDEKKEQKSAVAADEALMVVGEMKGWGSTVGVYVTSDQSMPRADLKKLLTAINDNHWLDLEYFGGEVPKVVGDHFLKGEATSKSAEPGAAPDRGGIARLTSSTSPRLPRQVSVVVSRSVRSARAMSFFSTGATHHGPQVR